MIYLLEDCIGLSSKIVYGTKGEAVKVIKVVDNMTLVENKGISFFVRSEKLSSKKIEVEKIEIEQKDIVETKFERLKKRANKKVVINNQIKLF